jgi:Tfp pilus assembly protein PilF
VSQLSISDSARQKYMEAQKDLGRRDIEGAIARLREAIKIAPKYEEAWNSLGVVYYQTKDYPHAEECFRKAAEIAPSDWTPTVNLGGVLLNLGRPQDALRYNQSAVRARPNDALANSQLGINYFHLGQMEKAEQYLATAERLDPSHFSHPQLLLAEIYARRGDRANTLRELKDFMVRFPDSEVTAELRKKLK